MFLVFNGVSSEWYIWLYNDNREYISHEFFEISWNESTKTIPIIDNFLARNTLKYSDIHTIVCVVGPGSFTGIRTITLVVNTLAYIYQHIYLHEVNFFDLYWNYPIVKKSSKRDLFVKYSENDIIKVVKNDVFEEKFKGNYIYWDIEQERLEWEYILKSDIDYDIFLKNLTTNLKKTLAPLYCKKPNIS